MRYSLLFLCVWLVLLVTAYLVRELWKGHGSASVFTSVSSDKQTTALEVRFVHLKDSNTSSQQRSWGGRVDRTDLEVESLQYYFTSIQLAQEVDLEGTGYRNPTGVLSLYTKDQTLYDSFDYAAGVSAASDPGYKELMDNSFVITPDLTQVTQATPYSYILLNWMRPIRIKATAQAQTVDGTAYTALYTKAGGTNALAVDNSGPQPYEAYQTTITNMNEAPAETAVILNQNGGSFLKLQTPLILDPAQRQKVVLVVDPYVNLRAGTTLGGANNFYSLRDEAHGYFNVPISDMTAVILGENASLIRHRYRISLHQTQDTEELQALEPQWDLLLQTYASSEAPTQLLAVNLSIVKLENDEVLAEEAPQAAAHVFFLKEDAGVWAFQEYDQRAFVKEFTPASTGTCQVRCAYQICGSSQVMQQEDVYKSVNFTQID